MTPEDNIALIEPLPALIPGELHSHRDKFADDFEWHYFNNGIPQINKTYKGFDGLLQFFDDLAGITGGTFRVKVYDIHAFGPEFVVVHAMPSMVIDGMSLETDAVVTWRIVDGKIAEAWDMPGLNSAIREK